MMKRGLLVGMTSALLFGLWSLASWSGITSLPIATLSIVANPVALGEPIDISVDASTPNEDLRLFRVLVDCNADGTADKESPLTFGDVSANLREYDLIGACPATSTSQTIIIRLTNALYQNISVIQTTVLNTEGADPIITQFQTDTSSCISGLCDPFFSVIVSAVATVDSCNLDCDADAAYDDGGLVVVGNTATGQCVAPLSGEGIRTIGVQCAKGAGSDTATVPVDIKRQAVSSSVSASPADGTVPFSTNLVGNFAANAPSLQYPLTLKFYCVYPGAVSHTIVIGNSDTTSYTFGVDGGVGCPYAAAGQHIIALEVEDSGTAEDSFGFNIVSASDGDPTFALDVDVDSKTGTIAATFLGDAEGTTKLRFNCDKLEDKIGGNLGVWWATDSTMPECDRMKSSTWDEGGGGWGLNNGAANVVYDADGWPLSFDDTNGGADAFLHVYINREIHRLNDPAESTKGYYPGGTYSYTCGGAGDIMFAADGDDVVKPCPGAGTFEVVPSGEGIQVRSLFPGGAVDVVVNGPDSCTGNFRDGYLEAQAPFHGPLRPMDWNSPNKMDGTPITDVTRTQVSRRTWTQTNAPSPQVPWERQIELANALNRDLWFSIPDQATAAYVSALAVDMCTNLDAGLLPIVGFSNEVWNPQFTQHDRLDAEGLAQKLLGPPNGYGAEVTEAFWWYRYIEKMHWVDELFAAECGTRPYRLAFELQNADLPKTNPTQSFGTWVAPNRTKTIAQLLSTKGPDGQNKGFVAGAPYYEIADSTGTRISRVLNHLTLQNWTPAQWQQAFLNDINLHETLVTKAAQHVAQLAAFGLEYWFYEGNSHISDTGGPENNQTYLYSMWGAHRHSETDKIVQQYRAKALNVVGHTPMALYIFGGPATKFNNWPLYECDPASTLPCPDGAGIDTAPRYLGAIYEYRDTIASTESTITLPQLCDGLWEEGKEHTFCFEGEREGQVVPESCQQVVKNPQPIPVFDLTETSFSGMSFTGGAPASYAKATQICNSGTLAGQYSVQIPVSWVTAGAAAGALDPNECENIAWTITPPSAVGGDYSTTVTVRNDTTGFVQTISFAASVTSPPALEVQLVIDQLAGTVGNYTASDIHAELTGSATGQGTCLLFYDCPTPPCAGDGTYAYALDDIAAFDTDAFNTAMNAGVNANAVYTYCFRAGASDTDRKTVNITAPVPDASISGTLQATAEEGVAEAAPDTLRICSDGDFNTTVEAALSVLADDCTADASAPNTGWMQLGEANVSIDEPNCVDVGVTYTDSDLCDAGDFDAVVDTDCTPDCASEPIQLGAHLKVSSVSAQLYSIDFGGAGDPANWADPSNAYAQTATHYRMTSSPEAHAIYRGPGNVAETWSDYEECVLVTSADASSGVGLECLTNGGASAPTAGYRVRANNAPWEFNHFGADICKNQDLSPSLLLDAASNWIICLRCDTTGVSNEIDAVVYKQGEARPPYDGTGVAGVSAVGSCTDPGRLRTIGAPALWSYAGGGADKDWDLFEVNNLGGGGGSPSLTNALSASPNPCLDGGNCAAVTLQANPVVSGTTVTECKFWDECPAQSGDTQAQAEVACGGLADGTDAVAPYTRVASYAGSNGHPWSTCTDGTLSDGAGATVTVTPATASLTCTPTSIVRDVVVGSALPSQQVTCTNSGNAASNVSAAVFTGTSSEGGVGTGWVGTPSPATATIAANGGSQVFTLPFVTTALAVVDSPATTTFRATDQVGAHNVAVTLNVIAQQAASNCTCATAGEVQGCFSTTATRMSAGTDTRAPDEHTLVLQNREGADGYKCGVLATGDIWIVGEGTPQGVTTQSRTPAYAGGRNGWMVNPERWDVNHVESIESYNFTAPPSITGQTFTNFPTVFISEKARSVSVSGSCQKDPGGIDDGNRSCMGSIAAFVFVSAPPDSDGDGRTDDEFRPTMYGAHNAKPGPYRVDQLDLSAWPSLPHTAVSTERTMEYCRKNLSDPFGLAMLYWNFQDQEIPFHSAVDQSSYGSNNEVGHARCISAMLLSNSGISTTDINKKFKVPAVSDAEARSAGSQALVHFVQRGIDMYGMRRAGKDWCPPDEAGGNGAVSNTGDLGGIGGHWIGRKLPSAVAGHLLRTTDPALQTFAKGGTLGVNNIFCEDNQFYVSPNTGEGDTGKIYQGFAHSFCATGNFTDPNNWPEGGNATSHDGKWCRPKGSESTHVHGAPDCTGDSGPYDARCGADAYARNQYPFYWSNATPITALVIYHLGAEETWRDLNYLRFATQRMRGAGYPVQNDCGICNEDGDTGQFHTVNGFNGDATGFWNAFCQGAYEAVCNEP